MASRMLEYVTTAKMRTQQNENDALIQCRRRLERVRSLDVFIATYHTARPKLEATVRAHLES